jgi:Putative prokaryotic signal transducing protein
MPELELVAVRTFLNRIEAELARSALEAAEIDAMVSADDAGGASAGLWVSRGVRLLVRAEDVCRAEDILGIGCD